MLQILHPSILTNHEIAHSTACSRTKIGWLPTEYQHIFRDEYLHKCDFPFYLHDICSLRDFVTLSPAIWNSTPSLMATCQYSVNAHCAGVQTLCRPVNHFFSSELLSFYVMKFIKFTFQGVKWHAFTIPKWWPNW